MIIGATAVVILVALTIFMWRKKRMETFVPKVDLKRYTFPKRTETFVSSQKQEHEPKPSSFVGCTRTKTFNAETRDPFTRNT
jgi:hypothetical protein